MVDGSARISDIVGAVSRMSEEQVSVPIVESRMSSHPALRDAGEESLPGSPNLRTIRHPRLGLWIDFRKRLAPRYVVVWTDLTLCILLALGGFAAAGFNRHLLHHWDPTISYTRFNDMQNFLAESGFGEHIQSAQSSYFATALLLFRRARDANQ